jgi:serine protease Do
LTRNLVHVLSRFQGWEATMLKIAGLCAAVMSLAAGLACAQEGPTKTVGFERLVMDVPKGTVVRTEKATPLCYRIHKEPLNQTGDLKVAPYQQSFRNVFAAAGLHPYGADELFSTSGGSAADYALGGIIKDMKENVCYFALINMEVPNYDRVKGDGAITIEWQLFSRLENKVVARPRITAVLSVPKSMSGGVNAFDDLLMAEGFKALAVDPTIRAALSGAGLAKGELFKPTPSESVVINGVKDLPPAGIDHAAASVMVIYAGNALGSGVLISRDGYIITDAHVVGNSKAVRLRWADGKESVAQVIRVAANRDVALLKTDGAAGRNPLPLNDTPPAVGSTVYAVGSPEGDLFQGTVTRGIISAIRPLNGLNYIQSDVTTGHGGSGGPLLDDKGYVIGLTDIGIGHSETSSGLNFFTPVKDLVAFLALDLR